MTQEKEDLLAFPVKLLQQFLALLAGICQPFLEHFSFPIASLELQLISETEKQYRFVNLTS